MENELKETILQNALLLQKHKRHKSKSKKCILNKWFEDSTETFLMQCVAGTLLVDPLKMKDNKEVQKYFKMNRNPNQPIYISCILKYFELIIQYDLSDKLNQNLLRYIKSGDKLREVKDFEEEEEKNYNVPKRIRNSYISALLYCYFNLYEHNSLEAESFLSFEQVWNLTFPDNLFQQERKNKYQVRKEEKLEKEENDLRRQQQQQGSSENQLTQNTNNPESVSPCSNNNNNNNNNKESNSKQREDMDSLYYTLVKQNRIQEEEPFQINGLEQDQNDLMDFEQNNQLQMSCYSTQEEWKTEDDHFSNNHEQEYEQQQSEQGWNSYQSYSMLDNSVPYQSIDQ